MLYILVCILQNGLTCYMYLKFTIVFLKEELYFRFIMHFFEIDRLHGFQTSLPLLCIMYRLQIRSDQHTYTEDYARKIAIYLYFVLLVFFIECQFI